MQRTKWIEKVFLILTLAIIFTSQLLGTEVLAYYENDITPPWGRIYVEKSVPRDGISYVGSNTVTTRIYANDDICKDEEIKYYISTEEISDTSKLADNLWKTYKAGESTEITLDEDGTKKIYAIFKDANGNTSLIYEEDAENTQNIIFDANGGFGVPENINTTRVHGMSYILPTDTPYKRGYTFLGWSTDSKANVPSYREGDAVPPDASLGTEDKTTLYAIYGTDLSSFPDLVDVVEVGDYVNYPVYYDNVVTWNEDSKYTSKLNGWRVLSGDKETGEVTLISAGVPLTLYKSNATTAEDIAAKMASAIEFLNIDFTTTKTDGKFVKNGFDTYSSLIEAFTNKYTKIVTFMNKDNATIYNMPMVRAMTKENVDSVYQHFGGVGTTSYNQVLSIQEKDMITIPSTTNTLSSYYWLASANSEKGSNYLYFINGDENKLYSGHTQERGVRPVVTLKANVKAIGQNLNGAWDIGIEKEVMLKPTAYNTKYTGTEQTVSLKNFDSKYMEVTGEASATEVGTYTALVSIKDTSKYTWVDGTTEPIELTWNIEDIAIGDFVEYGIEYTDVYTNYEFSGEYAWRLLNKFDNEDGTSNIEIISTGIPAKLYYSYSAVPTSSWSGNPEQVEKYVENYYVSLDSNKGNRNMKAATGLLYNFEKIVFELGTGTPAKDQANYVSIFPTKMGLFKAGNLIDRIVGIRSVMHADLVPESPKKDIGEGTGKYVEPAKGLFTLKDLEIKPYTKGQYYLASPCNNNYNSIRRVEYNGNVSSYDGNESSEISGLRPVVSIINVILEFEDDMWKIK